MSSAISSALCEHKLKNDLLEILKLEKSWELFKLEKSWELFGLKEWER